MRSAIVCSVRGVREMISFLGFDGDLEDILDKVEKHFRKQLSGDHLQQEFYELSQEKTEKIWHFTGHLEMKYKHLKEKFLIIIKICKSMRYLYKKPEVTYEEFLLKTLEA